MRRKAPRGKRKSRNQGNTMHTMARQKSTMVKFWSSISTYMARRTSTVDGEGERDRQRDRERMGDRKKYRKRYREGERTVRLADCLLYGDLNALSMKSRQIIGCLTLVHVTGEEGEDAAQRCRVK
jgi:hypothetical protein